VAVASEFQNILIGLEKAAAARTAEAVRGQEMFKDIFENSPEGLYQICPDGALLLVSPALAGIHGCASHLSLSLKSKEPAPGMVLRSNVETRDGMLILCAGHQINDMTLEKIRNFERVVGTKKPILVENTAGVKA